jgi:competence protein ComEA
MPSPSLKFSVALCALVLLAPPPVLCETVDANTATEAQLDGLLGLGPATTRLILAERDKARFKNWQDLIARVKGLGPKAAAKLSAAGLNVNGQPYVATVQRER